MPCLLLARMFDAERLAFNSLFEMPCLLLARMFDAERLAFNSLFEMQVSVRRGTAPATPAFLSILYLRCQISRT